MRRRHDRGAKQMIEKVGKLQRSKTLTQPKTAAVINDKTVENERNNIHGYGCSFMDTDVQR